MTYYRNPLSEDALKEIWKHHAADIEATRTSGAPAWSQAQTDRRVLLVEVQRLNDQITAMDLELIEAQGRLQDLEEFRAKGWPARQEIHGIPMNEDAMTDRIDPAMLPREEDPT